MSKRRVLITGIRGQDATILARFLLNKNNYEVYGMRRSSSSLDLGNSEDIKNDISVVTGDLTDQTSINNIMKDIRPDECYNLAAQSFVGASFAHPEATSDITGLGVLRMLEAVKQFSPNTRFYQASSSEIFGAVLESPQCESTPPNPVSPYGAAKLYGHNMVKIYRESYGLYAVSGILFNHSSKFRGEHFATRKITRTAAMIKLGLADKLAMGNIEAFRDEGSATDYMEAAWLMLQQEKPDDYVIATGEMHTIKEMIEVVFEHIGLDYKKYLVIDPQFFRPNEVHQLLGNASKAKRILNWSPKTSWKDLLIEIVEHDLQLLKASK